MQALSIAGLSHAYGTREVLRSVDLEVPSGELMVLVGPTGCGKTTLLRLIAGLDSCATGRIDLGGRNLNRLPPHQRDVAMVFQDLLLYPHLNVAQNLRYGLQGRSLPAATIAQRVQETAELLQVDSLLTRMPGELSGGQQQRVAIGRAIARRPSLLLLDEPFAHLDAPLRYQLREALRDVHRQLGLTTLYVTHAQDEALSLADRLAVMLAGEIRQVGLPHEVYRQPRDIEVGRWVGDPAINVLRIANGSAMLADAAQQSIALEPGDACRVGIRPESLRVVGTLQIDKGLVLRDVKVERAEFRGADTLLIGRWYDQRVQVLVRSELVNEDTLGTATFYCDSFVVW